MNHMSAARELGVSQSTYQRWEAGTLQIPEKKLGQISKLFETSKTAILGAPQPFDLFGIDRSIGDDRTYYGEVAIHFKSGGVPLLLPIAEAVHGNLFESLQQAEAFDYLSNVEDEFASELLADAKSQLRLTDTELEELVANGSVKPEDRQKVRAEVAEAELEDL